MKVKPSIKLFSILIMSALVLLNSGCDIFRSGGEISWPTHGWKVIKPEDVGMDSELVEAMIEEIDLSGLDYDSIVVVHKGVVVAEKYYFIYKESTLHETYSVTKSVISALVGIALQQGCIDSIDDPVLAYFPDREFQNLDDQKESLTIKDVLTMSSGLAYDPDEMYDSEDWAQYTLDEPLIYPPGESWFYSNGGPQVLSALINQACEMDTLEFADQYLFKPLGITNYHWDLNVEGNPNGSWGLELTPRDMAKFGYLYLHDGVWEGEQILPPDWVAASIRRYHKVPDPLEPWNFYYGFLWWVHGDGFYAAHGYKGQFIYLAPEQDLVVVITANISDKDFAHPQKLIRDYLIPAVEIEGLD
jgi:CubicO group peptidase (beta-lactamase class C family)